MKALTLHQPVATLMGLKDIENRKWKPHDRVIGQRIAIHAGKTWNPEYALWARRLSAHDLRIGEAVKKAAGIKGAIVSTAIVVAWYDKEKDHYLGTAEEIRYIKRSPWFMGPVGWLMTDFVFLDPVVECKGALGLWRVPESLGIK